MEIRRNRDRLAGSSVSIVGFYDGILTVHLAFSHDDNTGTAFRGSPLLSVREKERAERELWTMNDERNERARRSEREERRARARDRAGRVRRRKKGRKGEREKEEAYKIDLKGCGLARLFIIKNDKSNRFSPMRCGLPRVAKRDAAAAGRRRNEKEKKWECMVGNNECNAPSSSAPLTTKTAPRAGVVAIAVVTADCFGLTIILSRRV